MKYVKYCLMLFIILLSSCLSGCKKYESDRYGDGSKENPYLIYNEGQFLDLGGKVLQNEDEDNFKGKHYKLMNDLNFAGVNFKPIGINKTNCFSGVFDGNNHTIRNVRIDSSSNSYLGVFGYLGVQARIENLNVENLYITSEFYGVNNKDISAGGIVGFADSISSITNCSVSGVIDLYYKTTFEGYMSQVIQQTDTMAGGIVGWSMGDVIDCYASVIINADCSGGIVGFFSGYHISNCISENSEIYGGLTSGGIVGGMQLHARYYYANIVGNEIINGKVVAHFCAGGLLGAYAGKFKIVNNYIDAEVTMNTKGGPNYVGGVVALHFLTGGYAGYSLQEKTNIIEKVVANVDIKINSLSDEAEKYYIGYFGSVKKANGYNERLFVMDSLFNGSINLKNPVDVKDEETVFENTGVILNENNNVNMNEELIIEGNVGNAAKVLALHSYLVSYKDGKYKIDYKEDIFGGLEGDGSETNPYLIKNMEDYSLMLASYDKVRYFKLVNDLDATGYSNLHYFHPIGATSDENKLMFVLDGNNKIISNLELVERELDKRYCLFACDIKDSIIKDLNFKNLKLTYFFNNMVSGENNDYNLFNNAANSQIKNVNIEMNVDGEEKKIVDGNTFSLMVFPSGVNNVIDNLDMDINFEATNVGFSIYFKNEDTSTEVTNNDLTLNYSCIEDRKVRVLVSNKNVMRNNTINYYGNHDYTISKENVDDTMAKVYVNDVLYVGA